MTGVQTCALPIFGFAMKATYAEVDGKPLNIWKDPKTDDGVKKSAKGLLMVDQWGKLHEEVTHEQRKTGLLELVFKDGHMIRQTDLKSIRRKLQLIDWANSG